MNVIIIKVNFEKRTLQKERVVLTAGDYNSTKLVFQFDKDYEEKKVFELAKPGTSEAIFVKEIVDNEIVLVGYDAEGNEASIFSEIGKYPFEISLYGENSKLTSLSSTLTVKEGKVEVDNKVVECYIPIFDDLMNTATTIINNLEATEEGVQKAEESRATNENARQEAEEERVTKEGERAEAEENRNSAETKRVEAENARSQNEETRQSNEEERINNETARGDAEKARSEAEEERNENETTRTQNEEKRVAAETSRVKAEEARETSEKARIEAEKNRVTAESERAEDEKSRADAEKSRTEAETKRVDAEKVRDDAEKIRSENETTRQTNETRRVEAEATRNTNESTRIANEIIRQEKFRMIDNVLKSIYVEGSNIHVEDSADWFAKVNVCGKSEQETREGYNKLENTATTQTIKGVTYTVNDDKTITVNGTADSETNSQLHINSNLQLKEGTYTIKKEGKNGDYWLFINLYNGNTYVSTKMVSYRDSTTFTISKEESNYRCDVGIEVKAGYSVPNVTFHPQIVAGTEDKEYEPYGKMPSLEFSSEIKSVTGDIEAEFCNKNLCNNLVAGYWVPATKELTDINSKIYKSFFAKLKAGTYTLSSNISINIVRAFTDYRQLNTIFEGETTNVTSFQFTVTEDTTLYISVRRHDNTEWLDTQLLQLERGEATDYTPHQSQTYSLHLDKELHGDETVRDRIVRKDGKWCYKFNWIKYVFTGEETTFTSATQQTNTIKIPFKGLQTQIRKYDNNILSTIYSNMFRCFQTAGEQWHNTEAEDITINIDGNITFSVSINYATTTDEFKTKLKELHDAGTPVYVICLLAEPIYEEIIAETLIAQLDALEKAYTYQNITNISSDAHLEVVYKKDLQTQLNEIQALVLESGV